MKCLHFRLIFRHSVHKIWKVLIFRLNTFRRLGSTLRENATVKTFFWTTKIFSICKYVFIFFIILKWMKCKYSLIETSSEGICKSRIIMQCLHPILYPTVMLQLWGHAQNNKLWSCLGFNIDAPILKLNQRLRNPYKVKIKKYIFFTGISPWYFHPFHNVIN